MATGGVPVEVDGRVTCSVCLEPFRGRQPKLLPCFHTFCLPCLTQLTHTGTGDTQVTDGSAGTSSTVTCPTLPPGGVHSFQTNFYIDDGVSPADTVAEPDIKPKAQEKGDLGDDLLTKVKEQVKMMETMKSRLSEDEQEISRQRKVVERDIQSRYDTGVRMLGDCRAECLVTLKGATEQLTDKLQAEMCTVQLSLSSLQQLAAEDRPDLNTPAWEQKARASLLSDAAVRHFRQLSCTKEHQPSLFSYTTSDNNTDVTDSLRHFMGTVAPSGGTVSLQSAIGSQETKDPGPSAEYLQLLTNASYTELVKLRHELTTQQTLTSQLQADKDQLRLQLGTLKDAVAVDVGGLKKDITAFGDDVGSLRKDITRNTTNFGSLQKDMATFGDDVGNLRKDVGGIQKDMATFGDDVGSLRKDVARNTTDAGGLQKNLATVTADVSKLQNSVSSDVASLQKDATQIQQSQKQADTVVTKLQTQIDKLNTSVFFNAQLTEDSEILEDKAVILDKVLTNTGGGYNATTGVFTAPLTGTYLLMATARADSIFTAQLSPKLAVFRIMADSKEVAHSWSKGVTSCTTHALVRLQAGHTVWLKSNSRYSFRGEGFTSFCGVLVQPDL